MTSVYLFLILVAHCLGADILVIIPTPSYSHQIPFRPLWKELAKRGHNITLVTSDPIKDPSLANLKEIDISYGYEFIKKHQVVEKASNDSVGDYEKAVAVRMALSDTNSKFFQSAEGQNLIHNKDNRFDLLIVEAQMPAMMVFSWKYQVPFIGVSSLDCSLQYHETAGNLVHPLVTPDLNIRIDNFKELTFWERLHSVVYHYTYKYLIYNRVYPNDLAKLKLYFGQDVPPLGEIQNNMSMLFIATNPIFHPLRPLMPNTITIGNGMQLAEIQPLSPDIQRFLDDSKQGAIYFSLGSNVKSSTLNETTKTNLIKAFAALPYGVLWKFDEEFDKLPRNVRVHKWFSSQADILRHPNVKAFISQGGLQSMQESIYANKPIIGIPFFGDQFGNVKRMVSLGYGLKVDKNNITQQSIREAVTEIINNPKYSEKAKEYGDIFRDVDVPNVDRAVWWIEYVLRHNGARHFRNPMLDMPFWKVYMLDVILALGLGLKVFLVLFRVGARRLCFRKRAHN